MIRDYLTLGNVVTLQAASMRGPAQADFLTDVFFYFIHRTVHLRNTLSRPPRVIVQTAEPQAPCNNFCYADEILTRVPLVPSASLCHADWMKSRWCFLWPCAYSCSKLSAGLLRHVLKGLMCFAGFYVNYCTFLCNMHVWPVRSCPNLHIV